ncbi:MAG: hypothetical protein QOD12_2770 [Verrucomicrobiota bacterium]
MAVIGIDEGEAKFIAPPQLADEIRFPFRVHSHRRDEIRYQLRNLKANPARFIDAAMSAGIDCLNSDPVIASMLTMNGSSDDGRRETGQRPDLDDTTRRENADQSREKKVIARTDASRIADLIQVDHRVKEIEFTGRRNLSRVS